MLDLEFRSIYRSNGLIDDFVVYGAAEDYIHFSDAIKKAISSSKPVVLTTHSSFTIEVSMDGKFDELFTSLQSNDNQYFSHKDWEERSVLRVIGSQLILEELCKFLQDIACQNQGYSYISEFSESIDYSAYSPEWRLHIKSKANRPIG